MSEKENILGFIGAGNMAYGLIKGIKVKNPGSKICFYDPDAKRADFIKKSLGATPLNSAGEVTEKSDIVFIAVKPPVIGNVIDICSKALNSFKNKPFPIFVSIAGGVTIESIEKTFEKTLESKNAVKIFRVMPNINSLAGKGMSAICHNNNVLKEDIDRVYSAVEMSSSIVFLDEKYFDAVTALSGSGPAYIFLIAEGLIEAGVKLGLPRDISRMLTVNTMLGSSELLGSAEFSSISTKELKDMVTSPGGTTAYGIAKLEEGRIKFVLDSAVNAAYQRAKGLV